MGEVKEKIMWSEKVRILIKSQDSYDRFSCLLRLSNLQWDFANHVSLLCSAFVSDLCSAFCARVYSY